MERSMADQLPRVLLIDDNDDDIELFLMRLGAGPRMFNVVTAQSGADAIDHLCKQSFDCVVTDFQLGDMTADETIRVCQKEQDRCPILVVSSSVCQRDAVSAFRNGATDFISKREALRDDVINRRITQVIEERDRLQGDRRKTERRERHLYKLAHTDELTGMANRTALNHGLKRGRWLKDRRQMLSLVMIDLDHFKSINDDYGHSTGDDVLQFVSYVIRASLRESDLAVRWGGEEFLVVRHSPNHSEAWLWAETLRARIAQIKAAIRDAVIRPTISAGVMTLTGSHFGLHSTQAVDTALYLAKRRGRNQVCTVQMAHIEHLTRAAGSESNDIVQGRSLLLSKLDALLEPTQKDHVDRHCQEVAKMSLTLARSMDLPESHAQITNKAGLLHDIGKCVIPEGLISKPTSLCITEHRIMDQKADFGAWIADLMGADEHIVEAVRHQGTPFDGGAAAQEKPSISARILNVADALVSMTSPRPYRQAMTLEQALAELNRCRGTQFDPQIVEAASRIAPGVLPLAA